MVDLVHSRKSVQPGICVCALPDFCFSPRGLAGSLLPDARIAAARVVAVPASRQTHTLLRDLNVHVKQLDRRKEVIASGLLRRDQDRSQDRPQDPAILGLVSDPTSKRTKEPASPGPCLRPDWPVSSNMSIQRQVIWGWRPLSESLFQQWLLALNFSMARIFDQRPGPCLRPVEGTRPRGSALFLGPLPGQLEVTRAQTGPRGN